MVNQISVLTTLGEYVTVGKPVSESLTKTQSFGLDIQLIGFFGTETNLVASLGFVGVKAECLVGVDPETIKSPIIPVSKS